MSLFPRPVELICPPEEELIKAGFVHHEKIVREWETFSDQVKADIIYETDFQIAMKNEQERMDKENK